MKINCIAVDDEPLALKKMKQYIERVELLNLMALFDKGVDAVNFLKQHRVDVVFLDIQMNDLSGIDLLETMSNKPLIVFTTAYEDYAVQGYELNITDYLLKPISFKRFLKTVDKVVDIIQLRADRHPETRPSESVPENDYIFVKVNSKMQKLLFEDIHYIEAMKDYVRIRTTGGRILVLSNIKSFMEKLPANRFLRIHKSYAIALDKILETETGGDSRAGYSNREYLPESVDRRPEKERSNLKWLLPNGVCFRIR